MKKMISHVNLKERRVWTIGFYEDLMIHIILKIEIFFIYNFLSLWHAALEYICNIFYCLTLGAELEYELCHVGPTLPAAGPNPGRRPTATGAISWLDFRIC
jgi:hypothetical protein